MFGILWYWWLAVMFFMLVAPVGYGWGYRGWGPPFPSYLQRRREAKATVSLDSGFDYYAWGWGGDLMWVMFLFWFFWMATAFWVR